MENVLLSKHFPISLQLFFLEYNMSAFFFFSQLAYSTFTTILKYYALVIHNRQQEKVNYFQSFRVFVQNFNLIEHSYFSCLFLVVLQWFKYLKKNWTKQYTNRIKKLAVSILFLLLAKKENGQKICVPRRYTRKIVRPSQKQKRKNSCEILLVVHNTQTDGGGG